MEYANLIVLYSSDMLHPSSSTDTLYLPINDTTLNFQRLKKRLNACIDPDYMHVQALTN